MPDRESPKSKTEPPRIPEIPDPFRRPHYFENLSHINNLTRNIACSITETRRLGRALKSKDFVCIYPGVQAWRDYVAWRDYADEKASR
jgi:hypothetical protein